MSQGIERSALPRRPFADCLREMALPPVLETALAELMDAHIDSLKRFFWDYRASREPLEEEDLDAAVDAFECACLDYRDSVCEIFMTLVSFWRWNKPGWNDVVH